MTGEDDFQAMLDANPDDHDTRKIFGDFLEERGDPRGPGYRALGALRLCPGHERNDAPWGEAYPENDDEHGGCWSWWHLAKPDDLGAANIPWFDWYDLISDRHHYEYGDEPRCGSKDFWTRRQAEDDIARAFSKLPAERQRELLATTAETANR
jgi:uncharacterized protein (TIGR02996 family)